MKTKRKLLLLIAVETLILVGLNIAANQVSSQVVLPKSLLIALVILGIPAAIWVGFLKRSDEAENTSKTTFLRNDLTISEIWQRLKPRKRHKLLFKPPPTLMQTFLGPSVIIFLPVISGIFVSLYRANFQQYLFLALFSATMILFLFTLLILWLASVTNMDGENAFQLGCVLLFVLHLFWFGAILEYVVERLISYVRQLTITL
jgi:hypothetical protein